LDAPIIKNIKKLEEKTGTKLLIKILGSILEGIG